MNWWYVIKKQEMTRMWKNGKMIPVTLAIIPSQIVVRYKTQENDGYTAVVVWVHGRKPGTYALLKEFACDESFVNSTAVGAPIDLSILWEGSEFTVQGISKGKGFQWVIKRHHFSGGPETHGSKFHRAWWSTGNRKPRRTHKNHPMAGHMGSEKTTLKHVEIIHRSVLDGQEVIAFMWSLPGAYNTYRYLYYDRTKIMITRFFCFSVWWISNKSWSYSRVCSDV
jgi:large subunit ribosomal protein L3